MTAEDAMTAEGAMTAVNQYDLSLADLQLMGQDVGFDAIGATTADPFPELIPRLVAYAARGRTGFEWESVADRVDPTRWFAQARSLISVAIGYLTDAGKAAARQHPAAAGRNGHGSAGDRPNSFRQHGQVSVYAYGDDYHSVLQQKLQVLHVRLEERLGRPVGAKSAVDTAPLVDRRVAERAGIGWVGKNCNLYTEQHGSFVFLGTLAVDVAIEPASVQQTAPCGSCARCLDACPTGALLAPGVIDATRCLSYLTQAGGVVPIAYRAAFGRRVWGCDTCQWACPENARTTAADHAEFLPMMELAYPDLVAILHLSNRRFRAQYGRTAAAWRGLPVWQRNALIALGNCGDDGAVPDIVPFLAHAREELRATAAWALSRIDCAAARTAVRTAYITEMSAVVRAEMEWAMIAETDVGSADARG